MSPRGRWRRQSVVWAWWLDIAALCAVAWAVAALVSLVLPAW